MAMAKLLLLVALVAAAISSSTCTAEVIHALRPVLGSGGQLSHRAGVPCDSWRVAVEAYNKRDWKTVPAECESYVGHYMLGEQYRRDSRVVVDEAIAYAESLKLAGKGKEAWVFDIDETSLSNLPYYATHGFGSRPFNATSFNEYVLKGNAPALPETLRLYKRLISLSIRPVFLTGRTEDQRNITVKNLYYQGYSGWEKLLLKPLGVKVAAIAYKSGARQKLINDAGYVIVGNIGDQWSDILGAPEGARTFKLPDPMYYIG
ncbi:hypothetical protein PR202_ga11507 [Eleusine coracana subsp. coracana]|uniref:Acid phosphatase n=1 Tax=Eleusine coracana subsp. coracana TaxID=191504 RepID=A0AAV5C9T1_ELECO|nr:hypothetical protein PR202_ga11507 [Eleusine coracana subsp. coracana]